MQVKFNENNIAHIRFYKWDYGQELSFDSIPESSEVHFPIRDNTELAVVKVTDGKCSVPNLTLSLDLNYFDAFLYVNNGKSGKTKKTIHINLIQRDKPEGYVYNFEKDEVFKYETLRNILSEGQLSAIKLVDGHEKYAALREYQQSIAAGKYAIVYTLHDIYLDDDIEDESKLEMYQGTYILTADNMYAVSLGENTIIDMLDYITASYVKYSDYQEQIKAIIMLIDEIVKSCANEDLTQKRFDAVNERLENLEQAAGSLVNANEVKY